MSDTAHLLRDAAMQLRSGRPAQARALLETVLAREPLSIDARWLLAGAAQASGDIVAAERELRRIIEIDARWTPAQVVLGELLAHTGRDAQAEALWRNALARDRGQPAIVVRLAQLLLARGDGAAALAVTTPHAEAAAAGADVLIEHARALKRVGRIDAAIDFYRRAVAASPGSPLMALKLAATLEDAGHHVAAETAARDAIAKRSTDAETWLVLGRALTGQDRYGDAERAYRDGLDRHPLHADIHYDLAQLVWMRTEDAAAACAAIDAALREQPAARTLLAIKARVLEYAGDARGAYAAIDAVAARPDSDVVTQMAACQAALKFDPALAVEHARRAVELAPADPNAAGAYADALLAAGRVDDAANVCSSLLRLAPNDQHAIAILATAWRLAGDPRYRTLYDYATVVRGWTIDTPPGWATLDAYLADLRRSLRALHTLRTHPVGQSLRHGTQTMQNLERSDDPAIRAFFTAIDGPIRRHMAAIGSGDDPLRRRNTQRYRVAGAWSVQLRPNGFHTDHVHPEGWLSSACYIDLPAAVHGGAHEGWIKFGQPGIATRPPLDAEHYVQPAPGLLVLFPSYMWHGTVPFSGDETRLTIAFDVVPD